MTFVDVTSVVRAEEHQRLLVDELNHRVKNMLTVVISLADQTIRRAGSLEEFASKYMRRVHALSAAYALVSAEQWQTVSLRDVLAAELKPFIGEDESNIILQGPRVLLHPRPALALGMAVHELTTNATKFGALTTGSGRISIAWTVEGSQEGDRLHLRWSEADGPRVTPPAQRGFGLTLIERGLRQDMSAEVAVDFHSDGVSACIVAPLSNETEAVPSAASPVKRS